MNDVGDVCGYAKSASPYTLNFTFNLHPFISFGKRYNTLTAANIHELSADFDSELSIDSVINIRLH